MPFEASAVRAHLIGFPNADPQLHGLRPWALFALCLVPSLGALWYAFAGILDRYLFRKTLGAFLIATTALLLLYLLLDLQDNIGELRAVEDPMAFLPLYYGILLSQVFVLLAPFTVLLALLYALGQLSDSREIVAFTQTGRGIFRLLRPLVVLGGLLSFSSFLLNYHLAPWAEGYREALIDSANRSSASQATNILQYNQEHRRLWFIGRFPYDMTGEEPLRNVEITTVAEDGSLLERFKSDSASWDRETQTWRFRNPTRLLAATEPTASYDLELPAVLEVSNWEETPSQLIQTGLEARYLGIPGLLDWLHQNPDRSTFLSRSFVTQLHYRWAQPWLCLVAVLLAAPLGIAFSRRGRRGSVEVAVILAALMLFSSEVFLAFGDSGNLPAIPAAWATNVIFLLIAFVLIQRRLTGRPIYRSLKKCFPDAES
ncbi:MAG: LptF/LptG family permease [Verrucomicrobiota bacterium JB023]|nr:LptF/LptG family permease [Verrucomicrobiota bacterium JB023]